jgi:hypothetical protein
MPGPVVVIGLSEEIKVFPEWTVTPLGTKPTQDMNFLCEDQTLTTQRTPGICILLGILTFWTLLGLLFFLVKTSYTQGAVKVTAWAEGGFSYSTTIPVIDYDRVTTVQQQVATAQNVASQAREVARRRTELPPASEAETPST